MEKTDQLPNMETKLSEQQFANLEEIVDFVIQESKGNRKLLNRIILMIANSHSVSVMADVAMKVTKKLAQEEALIGKQAEMRESTNDGIRITMK